MSPARRRVLFLRLPDRRALTYKKHNAGWVGLGRGRGGRAPAFNAKRRAVLNLIIHSGGAECVSVKRTRQRSLSRPRRGDNKANPSRISLSRVLRGESRTEEGTPRSLVATVRSLIFWWTALSFSLSLSLARAITAKELKLPTHWFALQLESLESESRHAAISIRRSFKRYRDAS